MILSGTVFSNILEKDTDITIITPNNLLNQKQYKVAYVLHGLCGNSKTWLDYSMLSAYAMEGNTIYILPDAERSFYCNQYFDYITEELPLICKNIFSISSHKDDTIILGSSMGGYGALLCALSKPQQYGICGAFSSCCLLLKQGLYDMKQNSIKYQQQFGKQLINDFTTIFGESLTWKSKFDILENAKKAKKQNILPQIYLTCGTNDAFYKDHLHFCNELKNINIPFSFEQWNAQHDFIYFNEAIKKMITKYSL